MIEKENKEVRSEEQDNFKKDISRIFSRIGDIETHLINLIHPIQCLNKLVGPERTLQVFMEMFKDPIRVDDREVLKSISEFKASLDIYSEKMNLKALINAFMDISSMKFMVESMNDRLMKMESVLDSIHKEGLEIHFSSFPKTSVESETQEKKLPINKNRRRK